MSKINNYSTITILFFLNYKPELFFRIDNKWVTLNTIKTI